MNPSNYESIRADVDFHVWLVAEVPGVSDTLVKMLGFLRARNCAKFPLASVLVLVAILMIGFATPASTQIRSQELPPIVQCSLIRYS
jgi:hypothetical protein